MEREENGQFAKGNKGGPGRQSRKTEEKYLCALRECTKTKDWKAICERAIIDAKKGDRAARQWLSDYLLGKPQQFVDLTSGGEKMPSVTIYLPEIDDLETEPGTTGEVSP